MTTHKEALKLALEALDWIYKYIEAAPSELTEAKKWASIIGPELPRIKEALAQPKREPLETPLPCDVKVGHVTIRKGVALSVLVARMQVLYDMAQASVDKPKEPEQKPDHDQK